MGSVFALQADIYRTENGRPGKKILLQKAVQITTPADVEQFVSGCSIANSRIHYTVHKIYQGDLD